MDLTKALKLLESQDSRTFTDARQAILTQINQGLGIKQLVSYYSDHRSERAIELLCSVREPFDRMLLDQLVEAFNRSPLNTVILLGQIVQQSPSWVPKIAFHQLFKNITTFIVRKRSKGVPRILVEDISVLLFICNLLPSCSVLNEPILKNLSHTFIYASEQLRQTIRSDKAGSGPKDDVEEVHFSHLHYAVRQYFMTLYGVYPIFFTTFLRDFFSDEADEAKQKLYRTIVEPMTTLVRLHPMLIVYNKKKELEQLRWQQREPHDFLNDCRSVMIGAIPMSSQFGDGPPSDQEESSTVMSDVYRSLFPSKSSGTSNAEAWGNDEESADQEVERALMNRIDTPPGTRSHTPKGHTDMRSLDEPMVLEGKRRRSTGPSESGEKGRKSFRQTIGSIGKMFARSNNRVNESFHEEVITGVEIDGPRRNSELEEAEDAMDAIDAERVETPHVETSGTSTTVVSPVTVAAAAAAKKAEEARASARSLRGSMRSTPRAVGDTTPQKGAHPPTTPAASEEDGLGVADRSRSTSFLTTTSLGVASQSRRLSARLDHSVDEEAEERATATSENTSSNDNLLRRDENGHLAAISESAPNEHHMSTFFREHNRQRFRSECPPADGKGSMDWADLRRMMAEDLLDLMGPDGMASNSSTLKRVNSCPAFVPVESKTAKAIAELPEEERKMTMDAVKRVRQEVTRAFRPLEKPIAAEAEKIEIERPKNTIENFPYLALISEPCPIFYQKLEDDLEEDHEKNRANYMKASNEFHAKLKDLNMADRLPGKIYDDLVHILKGLPVEKQRDMLQARLSLVNQHLLYERSCRLLHANRNRRLFGRIKQQKVYEAELRMYREREVKEGEEKRRMISGLSEYRKEIASLKEKFPLAEQRCNDAIRSSEEKMNALQCRLNEAEATARQAAQDRNRYRAEHDKICRRAEDAEAELKIMQEKLETARKECTKLEHVKADIVQIKDELLLAERRRREESGGGAASPDWTAEERLRELESGLDRSKAENEKLRREVESLTIKKEESDRALKSEASKGLLMRSKLDRAARMLKEQNEAAQQKYISLENIVRRQEEFISDLFSVVEEAEERLSKDSTVIKKEMMEMCGDELTERSAEDSISEEQMKPPPRRSVLPDKCVADELPTSFFLIDPLRAASTEAKEVQQQQLQHETASSSALPSPNNHDDIVLP